MINKANLITSTRIIFSVILLFIKPLSTYFFILYLLCGMSDLLDGIAARRNNISSTFGATYDSTADFIFVTILFIKLFPNIRLPMWGILWIAGIAVIRFLTLLTSFIKYHTFSLLHTYSNKATGLLLFCFPIFYTAWDFCYTLVFLCFTASISALEEFIIMIHSKKLLRDIKSIFAVLDKT